MPQAALFNPSPSLTDALLASIADPSSSLNDIAAQNNTSLEALSLWIASPGIAERLCALHHIAAVRARLIASNFLAPALATLTQVLQRTRAQIDADDQAPPDKQRTPEQRHRTLETARRAAGKIISIANLNPLPLFHRKEPLASARGEAQSTPAASTASPTTQSKPAAPPPNTPTTTARTTQHQPPPPPPTTPSLPVRSVPTPTTRTRPSNSAASLVAHAGATSSTILDPPFEHWP